MWFIGVEVEEETSAPPPKKNPGSAPVLYCCPYPTSSPGLFPQKMGGAPHSFFEGKALGTRLAHTLNSSANCG